MRNLLFISDLQIPYHHIGALEFLRKIRKEFKIKNEDIYCCGDELDFYHGGMWDKSPEMRHTPLQELAESIDVLKQFYIHFPQMKLAISNHGSRYLRKATHAQIPSQMLRRYEDIIQSPAGWKWKKHWHIDTKKRILLEHGDDHGGQHPHIQAAMHNGCSTVLGHHHSLASIDFIKTNGLDIWGMVCGALIDFEAVAFDYARNAKKKPQIGASVVLNDGRIPIFIPMGSI